MQTIALGRTGLEVSRIAFGTWQLSGEWGGYDEQAAISAIHKAWDSGITLFDTAQAYGMGRSEQVLGRALRAQLDGQRDRVFVATKGGIEPGGPRPRRGDAEFIRRGVDDSLRFLGVDYIDLYQVHWPDEATPFEDTAATLAELVRQGKIRHVGVSNYDVDQIEAFSRGFPVETLQPPYHLFRRAVEHDILPYCRRHDIGVLAYSPLGSGLLTGTMTPDTTFAADDWRSRASAFTGEPFRRNLAIVERLGAVAAELGITLPQLATAWVLAQPGVHVAIVGARHERNIVESAAAGDIVLGADVLARIGDVVSDAVQVAGARPEGVD